MAQKTSINIKPCNVGSSGPHNRRTAEYLANIRKEKLYIRTDLMARNEAWVAPEIGDTSLTEYTNLIAAMVKEKTGRAMQTKDREQINKKTDKEHLEREDFIIAKQKQEAERAKAEKEAAIAAKKKAEAERLLIEKENKAKEQHRLSLDSEIADKEKLLKDERKAKMDSILDSVGSIVGVGKSAAVEKENARLKAENERIRKAFPDAVKNKVEERTKALVEEKRKAEAERDRALEQNRSLAAERDKVVRLLDEQKTGEQRRISQAVLTATAEKDKTIRLLQDALENSKGILNLIAHILYKASEVFRRAVNAIIHFGTEQHKSVFAPSEAADIKSVMQEYRKTTEQQKAVGEWLCGYAKSRKSFDEIKHRHTLGEVGDAAEGAYDWKIERTNSNGITR